MAEPVVVTRMVQIAVMSCVVVADSGQCKWSPGVDANVNSIGAVRSDARNARKKKLGIRAGEHCAIKVDG